MKQFICIVFIAVFSLAASAQSNAAHTRISVLTCGPGEDLYSLFGHTAIRVVDSVKHTDSVFNWGGFTFDQSYFYLKFMRGKLIYYPVADDIDSFMGEYVYEHRSVYEQVLNLDSISKQKIIASIHFNMEGDNRFYKYDFLLDNCTTRVKNIILENSKGASIPTRVVPKETTSRDLIHFYVERGGEPWIELGMDILLGQRVDRIVSNDEAMFVPEFLMKGLKFAKKDNAAFANNPTLLLQGDPTQDPSNQYEPLIVLLIISLGIFIITKLKSPTAKKITAFIDGLLIYVTGLLGILILFMWFGTDHTVCQDNFNLAWAFPLNFIVAFFMLRKAKWLSNYFFIMAVITAVFIASWYWLPQQLNIALLPVIILLLNRYIALAHLYNKPV